MGKNAGKFKQGFASAAKKELEQEAEQKRLHEKHTDIGANTVIVEKDNALKFTVRTVAEFIRLTATIAVLVLAAIGIMSLLYPEVRGELLYVLQTILNDAKKMIGM